MALTLDTSLPSSLVPRHLWRNLGRGLAGLLILASLLAGAWLLSRNHVTDLGEGDQLSRAGAYAAWQQGNVIMLVRHAERCDQSDGACLGPADGITLAGSQVAVGVGNGLARLGLDSAQVLASPLTRTRQTATFMFGHEIASADWLRECDTGFANNVMAHKQQHHNLVLVTHSGCIDHFLRRLKVQPGERDTQYTEAVMISVDEKNRPHLLGALKSDQWLSLAIPRG